MATLFRKLVISLSILICSNAWSGDVELVIDVVGVNPGVGYVVLALFSSAENHMNQPVLEKTAKVNKADKVTFVLQGLARGRYSLSVFYDENGNARLDTGLFGIPKELVGFSNNARGFFGPPSYDDSAFDLSKPTRMEILLRNAKE